MSRDLDVAGNDQGTLREQQLVRMDGRVLVSFVVPPGQKLIWEPPGLDIQGPCAGRVRVLPDGPWLVLAYFPKGYPGPVEPWPEAQDLSGAGPVSIEIDTGVFME